MSYPARAEGLVNSTLVRYEVHTISFQTFFVWAFKIVINTWKLSMLLLYILWDDWPNFRISGSNEQLQQQLEYTLLKADCHSWWIKKIQSDTLAEQYAIKFCFKLGKKARETYEMFQTAYRPSCMNWAWVFEWHKRFKEGRESVRDDESCGRSKQVNRPELIGQRVRVRVTMLSICGSLDRCCSISSHHPSNNKWLQQQCCHDTWPHSGVRPKWQSLQYQMGNSCTMPRWTPPPPKQQNNRKVQQTNPQPLPITNRRHSSHTKPTKPPIEHYRKSHYYPTKPQIRNKSWWIGKNHT